MEKLTPIRYCDTFMSAEATTDPVTCSECKAMYRAVRAMKAVKFNC